MPVPFGNYVLERWLAQGGMANIFIATYTGPLGFEKEVVLKIILPEYAHHSSFIAMFLDEARLAARLNHPNIVQVHDLGQVGGYFYIAMEYVPGPSLSRAAARARQGNKGLTPGLSVFIVTELLEALSHAHQKRDRAGRPLNIVHRDVTPQNVLLSFDGQVKLTDFGVAKANVNLHESQSGVIKGKYSHMAPEQCLTKPVDERADQFATGIVLWELLTGRSLFVRPTAYEMMKAVVEEVIPPPSQVNARCPAELDGVVLRALQRNPADRFPNDIAFLDALNLVARRLQIVEGKHELRAFLGSIFMRGRNNLAGMEEPGVLVTEDRISEILKGIGQPWRPDASDGGVSIHEFTPVGQVSRSQPTVTKIRASQPSLVSQVGQPPRPPASSAPQAEPSGPPPSAKAAPRAQPGMTALDTGEIELEELDE